MPKDTFSQKEGDLRFGPLLDLPGFCQFTNKILEVPIVFEETVENERVDLAGSRVLGKNGIEKGGVADGTDDQLIDLLGRPGTNKNDIDRQKDDKEDGENEKKGFSPQKGVPFKRF